MSKLTADRYGNIVIESNLTTARLKRAMEYVPDAASLKDDDGNSVFAVCMSKGAGSADKNGVAFSGTTTDGYAFVSINDVKMPAEADKKAAFLQEKYGLVLFKLNALENQINTALEAVDADIASVATSITVQ
jgi:uncharacterized membrane protein